MAPLPGPNNALAVEGRGLITQPLYVAIISVLQCLPAVAVEDFWVSLDVWSPMQALRQTLACINDASSVCKPPSAGQACHLPARRRQCCLGPAFGLL